MGQLGAPFLDQTRDHEDAHACDDQADGKVTQHRPSPALLGRVCRRIRFRIARAFGLVRGARAPASIATAREAQRLVPGVSLVLSVWLIKAAPVADGQPGVDHTPRCVEALLGIRPGQDARPRPKQVERTSFSGETPTAPDPILWIGLRGERNFQPTFCVISVWAIKPANSLAYFD